MAMAAATTSAAGARALPLLRGRRLPVLTSTSASASARTRGGSHSVSRLCSSFTDLSVGSWRSRLFDGRDDVGDMRSRFSLASTHTNGCISPRRRVSTVSKLKTHKAAVKRFRVTGSGLIVRRRARKQHLLRKKTTKRKNRLSKTVVVNRSDYDNVIGALPYLKVNRKVT